MDFIGTCWEDRAWIPWAGRLLQPENSQAWEQLCGPVPGQMAVEGKLCFMEKSMEAAGQRI